jgi:amino acid efflux transporter
LSGLRKTLNVYQGVGILVSTLLGSGIFIIPAMAATVAGSRSLIAWALTIGCVVPVAFTFSALGVRHPHAGGTAFFIRRAFGERYDNFTSWLYLSVVPIGPPVVIITGARYLGGLFGASDQAILWISVAMVAVMFVINVLGLRVAGGVQTLVSALIVALLLTLIAAAILVAPGDVARQFTVRPAMSDALAIGRAMSLVFWCFVGLEAIVHLSSEFEDVETDFPRTIVVSLSIVGALCVLLSAVVLGFGAYGSEQSNAGSVTFLVARLLGPRAAWLVGVMGFLTCFAAVNLYVLSFSRLMFSMSGNGVLPIAFSRTTTRNVPVNALAVVFALMLATIALKFGAGIDLNSMVLYANGIFISLYLLASVAGVALLQGRERILAVASAVICAALLVLLGYRALYAVAVCLFSLAWDVAFGTRSDRLAGDPEEAP